MLLDRHGSVKIQRLLPKATVWCPAWEWAPLVYAPALVAQPPIFVSRKDREDR